MRVAQLVETLETGGAEKLAVAIAGARRQAGDESYLITMAGLGPLSSGIDPGVAVINLGMNPQSLWSMAKALFRLGRLARRLQLDAMQTHLPRANFYGLALAMVSRLAVFPTVHNNREFDYGDHVSKLRKYLRRLAYRRLLVHGRRMIAVSGAVKQAMVRELGLASRLAGRIAVVPNGVAIPEVLTARQRFDVRGEFGVPLDAVLIVSVGRLTPQKNFGDLISALSLLDLDAQPWHCVVAGDGPEREALLALAQAGGVDSRIRFLGEIPNVDQLLAAADIFCMPSLWEGLPLALLEAMAAGLPVAAYDIDGVREVLNEGESGRLVAAGQVSELASALTGLLSDADNRISMGRSGCDFVKQNYGFERMAKQLGEIYESQDG